MSVFQEASLAEKSEKIHHTPGDDNLLGLKRQPESFETEHHVYSVPLRYNNVAVHGWLEYSETGIEILADDGSITIIENKPIVEVIVVGSGISLPNYNILEWWGEGESLKNICCGELIKRQKVEGLNGQYPNAYHRDILGPERNFQSLAAAEKDSAHIRKQAWDLTHGFTMPGSLPGQFFENTVRFRIGDSSRTELSVHKIVIRGGGKDYGDPAGPVARHHSNYAFRLIDVVVRKDGTMKNNKYRLAPEDVLPKSINGSPVYFSPADNERLGKLRQPEIFETEHRVYSVPFHYRNVAADGWFEYSQKGMEIMAEAGSIKIREEKPIVAVTTVGTGCSSPNYNTIEWWAEGEGEQWRKTKRLPLSGRLIKRQRVDDLKGQHNTSEMRMLIRDLVEEDADDAAKMEMIKNSQRVLADKLYDLSYGHHFPTVSIMNGLFENNAYFRIGDTSRPDQTAHEVVIRGGAWDTEDPYKEYSRFPADYAFRLIDVEVRKDGQKKEFAPLSPANITEADVWTPEEILEKGREVNRQAMIPFQEKWHFKARPGLPYGWVRFAPKSNFQLGEMRVPDEFEVAHHVYSVPFRHDNVKVDNWVKWDDSGLHLLADIGKLIIEENKPIIAVTIIGSGSVGRNYIMVDWYREGEGICTSCMDNWQRRVRIDQLDGQSASWLQTALAGPLPEFDTMEQARAFLCKIREQAAKSTKDFYSADTGLSRLYENTAHFRIGDTSFPDGTPYRVTITAGGLGGPTNPGTAAARYPADYAIRLVDVAVRKNIL